MDLALQSAAADTDVAARLGAIDLVVEHRISGGSDYHLSIGTAPRVAVGRSVDADVVFEQDVATAAGIASGRLGAHDAVLTGRLVVAGNIAAIRQRAPELAEITELFDAVRAATVFPAGGEPEPTVG